MWQSVRTQLRSFHNDPWLFKNCELSTSNTSDLCCLEDHRKTYQYIAISDLVFSTTQISMPGKMSCKQQVLVTISRIQNNVAMCKIWSKWSLSTYSCFRSQVSNSIYCLYFELFYSRSGFFTKVFHFFLKDL